MNRPARIGVPERVTSVTSTTPRAVVISIRTSRLARNDLERLNALAGVDHRLDSVALHWRIMRPRDDAKAPTRELPVS